jgi:hypothetical protein
MNTITMLLALVLGATLVGPSGPPVDRDGELFPQSMASPCCEAEMAEAYELRLAGELRAAHRKYHAVAKSQLAAGEFPGEALWEAAEVSYAEQKLARAARELDEVAIHASDFGRVNLEVRALFEAAILHHWSRRDDLALARLDRVERLLTSPEVSDDVRDMVAMRFTTVSALI